VVKIGENGGTEIEEDIVGYWPPNELDLSFPAHANDRAKFYQIRFKSATARTMTDRQTDASDLNNLSHAVLYSNGTDNNHFSW